MYIIHRLRLMNGVYELQFVDFVLGVGASRRQSEQGAAPNDSGRDENGGEPKK